MLLKQFMCFIYRLNEFTLKVQLPLIKHSLGVLLGSESGHVVKCRFKSLLFYSFIYLSAIPHFFLNVRTKIFYRYYAQNQFNTRSKYSNQSISTVGFGVRSGISYLCPCDHADLNRAVKKHNCKFTIACMKK